MKPWIACSIAALLLVVALVINVLLSPIKLLADEGAHGLQILYLSQGRWEVVEGLTTIPGYHVLLGSLFWLTGITTLDSARLVSSLVSLPAVVVFYAMARRLHARAAVTATLQFFLIPFLLPFYFLLYTDGLSLFLVLLSIYLAMQGRRTTSAVVGMVSLLVRQNNIVWVVFGAWILYLEEFGARITVSNLGSFARKNPAYVLAAVAFLAFMVLNGGVAIRDQHAHPMRLSPNNVYFLLFLYFLVLLPVCLARTVDVVRWCLHKRYVLIGSVLFFCLGYFTFTNDHPYNQLTLDVFAAIYNEDAELVGGMPFLRNLFLVEVANSRLMKALFFVIVTLSLMIILHTHRHRPYARWVLPFCVLFLAPSWLIEQRYTFVPLALLLLGRTPSSERLEWSTVIVNLSLGIFVLWGLLTKTFFL